MFYFTKRAIIQREAVLDQYAIRIYTYTVNILLLAFLPYTVSIYCCSGGQMMQGNMRGKVQMGVKNQECDDGKI